MTNGAMNVEIGNPAYKIYEGEPDDDAGELLDADFTLDPDKVRGTSVDIYGWFFNSSTFDLWHVEKVNFLKSCFQKLSKIICNKDLSITVIIILTSLIISQMCDCDDSFHFLEQRLVQC